MQLLNKLQEKKLIITTKEEIQNYIGDLRPVKRISTGISGFIEIFESDNKTLKIIVEEDGKHFFYIRPVNNNDVDRFIADRMAIYNKMWDGCGGKVNYENIWK